VERDGSVIVNLGRVEGVLPKREMAPNARYQPNERIKALVVRVDPNARGPMIILSRTVPEFVAKLFEQEVPEIAEGVVRIVKIAREPGVRTKIAVESTSKEIDAVGACVGLKGSRVQMVVRELDNERIDVVAYSPKPEQFVANALTPAEISSVRIIPEENKAIVIVKPNNLSLAIGSRGQNARLAAKLTGMTLDIHAEGEEQMLSKVNPEQINQRYLADLLTQKEIMEEGILEKLAEHGIRSVEDLTKADPYKLSEIFSSDVDWAQELIEDAQSYLEELEDLRKKRFSEQEG
jgi:N utilization substance protein A